MNIVMGNSLGSGTFIRMHKLGSLTARNFKSLENKPHPVFSSYELLFEDKVC